MFTKKDLFQLKSKGIDPELVNKQLDQFHHGFPSVRLLRPATSGDGLIIFHPDEKKYFQQYFDSHAEKTRILKFVPASGAATRMFKHLFEFVTCVQKKSPDLEKLMNDQGFNSVCHFISNLRQFAFYDELQSVLLRDGYTFDQLLSGKDYRTIIEYLLSEKGLSYANLPKALLAFQIGRAHV